MIVGVLVFEWVWVFILVVEFGWMGMVGVLFFCGFIVIFMVGGFFC